MADSINEPKISLGTTLASGEGVSSLKSNLEIPLSAFRRHVCILGKSGAGKSVTGMILAKQLSEHCAVLVLDRTGEFAGALGQVPGTTVYESGRNISVSPFSADQDGASDADLADVVERGISLMEHYLQVTIGTGLSPLQARVLRKGLSSRISTLSPAVKISDLIAALREIQERHRAMKGWPEGVEAVISRLHPFSVGRLARVFDVDSPTIEPERLFQPGLHIIDLDSMGTDEAKNLLSQTMASQISSHGRKMGIAQELRFVLVVDEAHHISPNLRNYLSVLERYALELRKYGMGLVVIATRPSLISENILANCNTVISHQLTGSKDIDLALNYMVHRLEVDRFLSEVRLLDVGDALVQLNSSKWSANPIKFHTIAPPEVVMSSRELASKHFQAHLRKSEEESELVLPPREDSAWSVYAKLPPRAREAVTMASKRSGVIFASSELHRISRSNVKEMIHGPYRLVTKSGNAFVLTQLGRKIATIHNSFSGK